MPDLALDTSGQRQRETKAARLRRFLGRQPDGSRGVTVPESSPLRAFAITALAVAGALVCVGQCLHWSTMGAWPPHDTAAYYLAGLHVREGAVVYGAGVGGFLAFLYPPPWAIVFAALSYLPLEVVATAMLGGQVLALRYLGGSWRNAALLGWLPFVPRELVTGNVNLMMAAVILAGARNAPGSGWPVALFAAAKLSPAAVLSVATRRQWRDFALATGLLAAITLPWLHLWLEWLTWITATGSPDDRSLLPLGLRMAVAVPLVVIRRPWAAVVAAAIATPAFYFTNLVLFIPVVRLAVDARLDAYGVRVGR